MKQKIAFMIICGALVFGVGNNVAYNYMHSQAADISGKLMDVESGLEQIDKTFVVFDIKSLGAGCVCLFFYSLGCIYVIFCKRNTMPGKEHGSAEWGTTKDIVKFKDKKFDQNMLLTATEWMSLNTRQTMRNNNILVIGGSGSGKTRFFLKPNLLQMHCSYVITDPKGTVLNEVGKVLADAGYKIKVFNTVDFSKSMKYNPFTFIKTEADIKVFTDILITSTKEKGEKSADQFWENAERLLYMALIGYIIYELPEEEHNFASLLGLINSMEVREEDESFMNAVDYAFEEIEIGTEEFCKKRGMAFDKDKAKEAKPEHFALLQYKKYKMAAGVLL